MGNNPINEGVDFAKALSGLMPKIKSTAASFRAGEYTEDLVQEGLLALYCATKVYDETRGVPFDAYAFTCIKNAMITAYRKISKDSTAICNFDDSSNMISTTPGPDELAMMTEDFEIIKSLIRDNLSGFEYKVLSLYLNGFSYSHIADALNKSEKSVDNALSRTKKKLSKLL